MADSAKLYLQYEEKMQRSDLFKLLAESYTIKKVLYPGSYIHISPSFYFSEVVYVDTDSKAVKFFSDDSFKLLISERKSYTENSTIRFYPSSYKEPLPEKENYFDLIVSQYAGFVSLHCKRHLKTDGLLLANNSHGDAGIAYFDPDFTLEAVINFRNGNFVLSRKNLERYFIPKNKKIEHSARSLQQLNRGIGYVKTASHYLFVKN